LFPMPDISQAVSKGFNAIKDRVSGTEDRDRNRDQDRRRPPNRVDESAWEDWDEDEW
jgi:hypothetical protein